MLWNNPIPVDPGSYTIEASAPGKKKWSTIATVGPNGADRDRGHSRAREWRGPRARLVARYGAPMPRRLRRRPRPDARGRCRPSRSALAGPASSGVGIGSFFGLRSIAKHSDYESLCTARLCANPRPVRFTTRRSPPGTLRPSRSSWAAALIAGGVVLWLVAPRSAGPDAAPQAGRPISPPYRPRLGLVERRRGRRRRVVT